MSEPANIGFYGGVGSVTGANFLLAAGGKKFLVDCGLFQGRQMCDEANYAPFAYDPAAVDALFITHAHLDHVGRIPQLVRAGFRGVIYSTQGVRELSRLILEDGAHIMGEEARQCGREAPYGSADIEAAMALWRDVPYYSPVTFGNVSVTLKNSGHILDSALIEFAHPSFGTLVFSGDLGPADSLMLRDADTIAGARYLVIESVYGDRRHESGIDRTALLEDAIEHLIEEKGTMLIPAFSIERTQAVLYELHNLTKHKEIPPIPVFLDSPLAIKATDVYRHAAHTNFNDATLSALAAGEDVFSFNDLTITPTAQESKRTNEVPGPKIIIAGSGMSQGGRIVHHEKRYLPDPRTVLLIVGYQAAGTLGRELEEGAKEVTIDGERVPVRARVQTIHGFSGHRDVDGLTDFVTPAQHTLKKVFVTMGEPRSSQFLVQRLRDYLGVDAVLPTLGQTFELK